MGRGSKIGLSDARAPNTLSLRPGYQRVMRFIEVSLRTVARTETIISVQ